jgi:carbon storage regulator
MLVFSRKPGESFFIGDDVEVTLIKHANGKTRIGITAPKNLVIHRSEVRQRILAECASVASDASTTSATEMPQQ